MAKRKKAKSKSRRRRVGAAGMNPNNPIVKYGSMALGYLMGDKINAQVAKMVGDKVDGKIIGAGEAGLGAFLVFGGGKKSMLKTIAGGVLLGAGAKKVMTEFGIGGIGPYGRVPVVAGAYGRVPVVAGAKRINGYTPNNALNGYTPNSSLNGKMKVMGAIHSGSGSSVAQTAGSDHMN